MKNRYAYLDGIRGIAAIFVLMRHTGDFWSYDFFRSYLAVDIFFILSGFVISSAYAKKMESGALSISQFFVVRLIRLYPVYFISLCIAIPVYIETIILSGASLSTFNTLQIILLSALFLPELPVAGGLLFPANGPYWSLFFELIANFFYAVIRPILTTSFHLVLIGVCAIALIIVASDTGHLDLGYSWGYESMLTGFIRATFGIFLGVLLHSNIDKIKIKPRPLLSIALICTVFVIPSVGKYDFIIDLLCIFVVFPVSVVMAATTRVDQFSTGLIFLGAASYPLYVLHKPVGKLIETFSYGSVEDLAPYSGLLFLLFLVPLAALLEKKIDEPVRKRITRLLLKRPQPLQPQEQSSSAS